MQSNKFSLYLANLKKKYPMSKYFHTIYRSPTKKDIIPYFIGTTSDFISKVIDILCEYLNNFFVFYAVFI